MLINKVKALKELSDLCHAESKKAGWWDDAERLGKYKFMPIYKGIIYETSQPPA